MTEPVALISKIPEATPLSRLLRFALGLFMLALIAGPIASASGSNQLRVAAAFVGLIIFYGTVHLVVTRWLGWINPWLGAVIAVAPAAAVFLGGGIYAAAVILFIGASLLLIAVLGHPGCEVLAFPSLLLGRRTHLACVLFSPIDWLEHRIRGVLRPTTPVV